MHVACLREVGVAIMQHDPYTEGVYTLQILSRLLWFSSVIADKYKGATSIQPMTASYPLNHFPVSFNAI